MNNITEPQIDEPAESFRRVELVDAAAATCSVAHGCAKLLQIIADDKDHDALHDSLWVMVHALRETASDLQEAADKAHEHDRRVGA